jgi:hypothetical protein
MEAKPYNQHLHLISRQRIVCQMIDFTANQTRESSFDATTFTSTIVRQSSTPAPLRGILSFDRDRTAVPPHRRNFSDEPDSRVRLRLPLRRITHSLSRLCSKLLSLAFAFAAPLLSQCRQNGEFFNSLLDGYRLNYCDAIFVRSDFPPPELKFEVSAARPRPPDRFAILNLFLLNRRLDRVTFANRM